MNILRYILLLALACLVETISAHGGKRRHCSTTVPTTVNFGSGQIDARIGSNNQPVARNADSPPQFAAAGK